MCKLLLKTFLLRVEDVWRHGWSNWNCPYVRHLWYPVLAAPWLGITVLDKRTSKSVLKGDTSIWERTKKESQKIWILNSRMKSFQNCIHSSITANKETERLSFSVTLMTYSSELIKVFDSSTLYDFSKGRYFTSLLKVHVCIRQNTCSMSVKFIVISMFCNIP